MALTLTSPAFDNGAPIPPAHSKDGGNASPPLEWSGAPDDTRSFARLVEDPDAPDGTFSHWAVYDIPADRTSLGENADLSAFGRGVNDFGDDGYGGPQPPAGHGVHHYHVRLAALDVEALDVVGDAPGAMAVWDAALRHILAEAELVGTFEVK